MSICLCRDETTSTDFFVRRVLFNLDLMEIQDLFIYVRSKGKVQDDLKEGTHHALRTNNFRGFCTGCRNHGASG